MAWRVVHPVIRTARSRRSIIAASASRSQVGGGIRAPGSGRFHGRRSSSRAETAAPSVLEKRAPEAASRFLALIA